MSIKANELRIGNWVKNDCNDELIQVDATDILTCSKDDDWLLPIPLTPELLEKCGFRKNNFGYDGDSSINLYESPKTHSISVCWGEQVIGKPIKHLHQLQNIYFSLTGEELQINL